MLQHMKQVQFLPLAKCRLDDKVKPKVLIHELKSKDNKLSGIDRERLPSMIELHSHPTKMVK